MSLTKMLHNELVNYIISEKKVFKSRTFPIESTMKSKKKLTEFEALIIFSRD